jgi:hypothetical protein
VELVHGTVAAENAQLLREAAEALLKTKSVPTGLSARDLRKPIEAIRFFISEKVAPYRHLDKPNDETLDRIRTCMDFACKGRRSLEGDALWDQSDRLDRVLARPFNVSVEERNFAARFCNKLADMISGDGSVTRSEAA